MAKDYTLQGRDLEKLSRLTNAVNSDLKKQFEYRFRKWKDKWFKDKNAFSSDTNDNKKLEEYVELKKLGVAILPLIAEKLIDPVNFVALLLFEDLQEIRKTSPLGKNAIDEIIEGEAARAQKTVKSWLEDQP